VNVTLVAVDSEGKTRDAIMKRARLVIGRKEGCDIRIPVASVSREHCEFRVEEGKLIVRDMGSSNGTYVNRERIQETAVSPGDLISVGPAVFVARIDGKPEKIDSAMSFASGSPPQPFAAAGSPGSRPASPHAQTRSMPPTGSTKPATKSGPGTKPAAKPKPITDDDDEFDLRPPGGGKGDSSISDMDFDFLDEDDEDKKKL
jgi:pSer/pThr/pTyr-binding forkhead associated (FHA) protein